MPDKQSEDFFRESPAASRRITIYALEGAHGVGKTTLTRILRLLNFHVVEEDFMDVFANFILPGDDAHNCMVEIAWASMQIINLVNMANNIRREILLDPTRFACFFLDRCFLTGSVYGAMDEETRTWYLRIFGSCIASLKTHYNIDFRVVRMKPVSSENHFEHICKRLAADKSGIRKELHEADRAHLDRINAGYDELEQRGAIDYTFDVSFSDTVGPCIAFPLGRFFGCIGERALAERYRGTSVLYDPHEDDLCGLRADPTE